MVAASPSLVTNARVAVVSCKEYGPQTRVKLAECFDKLGGIGALVKNKTVTVKINLTGTMFRPIFRRPVGESYMTHYDTVSALVSLLFQAGAVRVRLVESTNSLEPLEKSLTRLKWDLKTLTSLGKVEYENTRGRGSSKSYATLKVPGQGLLFSHFDLNRAYEDTDVFVSLAKMKNHSVCGITLAMKNLFGVTPNALMAMMRATKTAVPAGVACTIPACIRPWRCRVKSSKPFPMTKGIECPGLWPIFAPRAPFTSPSSTPLPRCAAGKAPGASMSILSPRV
jgi:uncharacterized protein (DUF362 family)